MERGVKEEKCISCERGAGLLISSEHATAAKDFDLKGKRRNRPAVSHSSFSSLQLSAVEINDKGLECIDVSLNAD